MSSRLFSEYSDDAGVAGSARTTRHLTSADGRGLMDLNRYLELYLSESHDHMRALMQGLLALESGQEVRGAVEEAFRAAHTTSISLVGSSDTPKSG